MLPFEQFVQDTLRSSRLINTMFEESIFALMGTLECIARRLTSEKIPYELIGGAAVMVPVQRVEPSAVRNTKDIDIMVNRSDLERIGQAAARQGFIFLSRIRRFDRRLFPSTALRSRTFGLIR